MTISRSGYATRRRNGSHRHHRNQRNLLLLTERVCWCCGQPGTQADPLEAAHVIPHSQGGDEVHLVHRSYNLQAGNRTITKGEGCDH